MPILDENTLEFISRSPEQTRRVGTRLGTMLEFGDVVCLCGELGAGKTTFAQGIVQGWGAIDTATSPTFVLVNNYSRPDGQVINHLDAFRLQTAQEAEDLDLIDLIEKGILLVEWPEKIRSALPENNLWIEMNWIAEQQRRMVLFSHGEHYSWLLNKLREQVYVGEQ